MATVFLSYRREDSRADAGRLYDHLCAHFGADHVFMDIDDIAAGENFVEKLKNTLNQSDLLLLVIGPRWQSVTDDEGRPRLNAPNDFVRLEVQSALERGIGLIPALVGGARMPARGELPSQLGDVVLYQAIEISDERFREDVDRLIAAIERAGGRGRRGGGWRRGGWLALLVAAVLVAAGGYLFYAQRASPVALRSAPSRLSVAEAKAMVAARGFPHAAWNAAAEGIAHDYASEVVADAIIVLDRATGLAWQQDGSRTSLSWEDARAYVRELAAQRHAGFDDWRLPTLEEAMSLMEPAKSGDYYLDPVFERGAAVVMWTADGAPNDRRWVVYYYDGIASMESASFNAAVRAVRGRARPDERTAQQAVED
jgi:hypothetical protein